MKSSWIIWLVPKSNVKCLYKSWKRRQTQREAHVKMKAQIGVMHPQTKGHLTLPELPGRGKGRLFPRASERNAAQLTP